MSSVTKKEISFDKKRSIWGEAWKRMKRNRTSIAGMVILALIALIAITAPFFIDYEEDVIKTDLANRLQPPSREFPLGTDELGRNVLFRILYGARISLGVGVASVLCSYIIGCAIGAFSGYYGGKIDEIIMRIMDMFMAIPAMLLMIAMVTALEPSIKNLVIAVSISSIPGITRMMRVQVLNVKNNEYVEAVKVLGASDLRIIFVHIIPNTLSPIIVQMAMGVAGTIMAISGLSFLGLGVQPPNPEWGAMLSSGRQYIRDVWHITLFPGLAILITVTSLTLAGDGLRDALDPKMKR